MCVMAVKEGDSNVCGLLKEEAKRNNATYLID
jgi:hypothetical protein